MSRPQLTKHLSAKDLSRFYWLKEELLAFCRANNLSTAGSKNQLASRIKVFLQTGNIAEESDRTGAPSVKSQMPKEFRRETVIGDGWHCSQSVRSFFEREIGAHFHFDGVMRDFIKYGAGKTLQEAIETWEAAQRQPKEKKEIAPQFEYNRHMREYFKTHRGATLPEAIQAWKEKKAKRRG